jgi:hypothetical protein
LLLQAGGRGELAELFAQRILPRAMFIQPARQFRIPFRQRERPGDLRVFRVRRVRAVKLQDYFCLRRGSRFWRLGLNVGERMVQLREAARQARFDGAERNAEGFGDFVVGKILQIKQRDGCLVNFIQSCERGEHLRGVEAVDRGRRNGRQFRRRIFQFDVRKADLLAGARREIRGAGW